jgi:hypothetical protein
MLRQALLSLETFYQWHRTRLWFLAGLIGLTLAALATLGVMRDLGWLATPEAHWTTGTLLIIFLAALGCEYLDSSLGMGYGTTLTPLLMLAGYEPLQIVPAVLLSELVTGLAAGAMHHRDGNIDLRHDPAARRTFGLLGLLSAVGAILAVMLAVKISAQWFSLLIVVIVLSMGLITLLTARRQIRYRRGGILTIGLIAAFNKGLSGGGYGPLVTSGQVVSGPRPSGGRHHLHGRGPHLRRGSGCLPLLQERHRLGPDPPAGCRRPALGPLGDRHRQTPAGGQHSSGGGSLHPDPRGYPARPAVGLTATSPAGLEDQEGFGNRSR